MIHISHESGRNDNIHGDEHTPIEPVDVYDVIWAIRDGKSTEDGISHHEWIKRICSGDEITAIFQHIVKHRHDKVFGEIMNEIETAIEGWL